MKPVQRSSNILTTEDKRNIRQTRDKARVKRVLPDVISSVFLVSHVHTEHGETNGPSLKCFAGWRQTSSALDSQTSSEEPPGRES